MLKNNHTLKGVSTLQQQVITRRKHAWYVAILVVMLGLLGSGVVATATPAKAVQSFNNAAVADAGLAELGTSRPTGWDQPGECIKSVQRWVTAAGGYFGSGGVISGYVNSGAQEVSLGSAVKGDVIQYTNGNGNDQDWTHVHTMVVINNHGNGQFDIVQSNSPAGSGLVTRANNIVPSPASGWVSRVWRFGTVQSVPSPVNNLQLSTVGTDGKVYTLGQTSPGTWSPNWAVINGNVKSTSITTTPDGLQHIAALGGDGNIYIVHQQANKQWGSWSQVQAQVTQVAIAATPEGKLHLAAIGTDGKVYVLSQVSTGGSWSPNWVVIDANNLTSISMTTNPANGKLNIAVTGTDSNIYVARQSASTGQWGGWSQVQAQVTQVAIAATPEGKLHIAARGTNGKVYVLDEVNTGGPWSPNWTEINGNIASVAMVSASNGKLHIASRGGDANIYIVSQSASTGQWGGWSQVQAQVTQVAITVA